MHIAQLFHTTRICEEAKKKNSFSLRGRTQRTIFHIFFGIVRNSLGLLFDDGGTGQEQHAKFLRVSSSFCNASFIFAWKYSELP